MIYTIQEYKRNVVLPHSARYDARPNSLHDGGFPHFLLEGDTLSGEGKKENKPRLSII